MFAVISRGVQSNVDLQGFLKKRFFPSANDTDLARLVELYPNDPKLGSPYNTGDDHRLTAHVSCRCRSFLVYIDIF